MLVFCLREELDFRWDDRVPEPYFLAVDWRHTSDRQEIFSWSMWCVGSRDHVSNRVFHRNFSVRVLRTLRLHTP